MDLIVEGRGCFVGKHLGRLRVSRDGKVVAEAPLIHLEHVLIVDAGVSISSDAVRVCAEEGIPIHFLDGLGHVHSAVYSAGLTGTVLSRRAQLLAYTTERGRDLAFAYVRGKLENSINLLRYAGKYRKETQPTVFDEMTLVAAELRDALTELDQLRYQGSDIEALRERVLSVEGRAAQRYWQTVGLLIPAALAWPGRETRGARDPFNSALNYGYGILYAHVERALVLAGLDPYGGFLHADRPGKPSLVLDAIEEFRQAVVDRSIIAFVNKGSALDQDDAGMLTEPARRRIAEKVRERLESTELYEGKRQVLRIILQAQARHAATFLRGDRPAYTPFVASW
jgi:CRISPR-associated protein Cas1